MPFIREVVYAEAAVAAKGPLFCPLGYLLGRSSSPDEILPDRATVREEVFVLFPQYDEKSFYVFTPRPCRRIPLFPDILSWPRSRDISLFFLLCLVIEPSSLRTDSPVIVLPYCTCLDVAPYNRAVCAPLILIPPHSTTEVFASKLVARMSSV